MSKPKNLCHGRTILIVERRCLEDNAKSPCKNPKTTELYANYEYLLIILRKKSLNTILRVKAETI